MAASQSGIVMARVTTAVDQQALVIIPTFNEVESIGEVIRRVFDACGDSVDVLVIDDGSTDGTAPLLHQLERDEDIHLIERSRRMGLGTAYVAGFRWAFERGYHAVVEMDADLSHDPRDIPRLLERLDAANLVIGSRYVEGGGVSNWGRGRLALSKAGNIYARALLGFAIKDSTSGFRAYKTSVLGSIDLSSVRSEGYAFQIEMTRRVHQIGGRITEIPITFVERATGKSKMSRRIVAEALVSVTKWGLRDRLRRRGSVR